jgi:hypothetical protein
MFIKFQCKIKLARGLVEDANKKSVAEGTSGVICIAKLAI